ncbi:MAG: rhodanese-like domain-containing protein [Euzebya sp.]
MIPDITPAAAAEAMRNGAVLLDVREPFEVAAAGIDGATHIPMGQIVSRINEVPTDTQVLCLCHHGGRSAQVAAYLAGQGYDVANVAGGIDEWSISHDSTIPRYA